MADDTDKEVRALCKLFIGGIPRSITDEQLAEVFIQFTEDETLNDCIVIKDQEKSSRGFGFVTYNKLSDTDNCLANRPHTLGGKEVEVKHAIPRDEQNPANHTRTNKIFVGGLPKGTSDQDVKEAIENYVLDVGESLNVTVQKVDTIDKEGTRGFCFVEMASEDDADKVVIVKYFNVNGKKVEAKKAEPKGQKGMSGGRGGRGGRGGSRDSNRGRGGGMGQYGGNRWGGGNNDAMWGGQSYGNAYDQFGGYGGGGYGDYGFNYGSANSGQYDLMGYGQAPSSFGPSRTSNGRFGGGRGGRGGRGGGGGGGYRPY